MARPAHAGGPPGAYRGLMDRRRSGVIVLLCAVVALLVVPRVLRPGIDGTAAAAPLPAPPPIGTCVVLAPRSATPVDCGQPHDGELFVTWTADDPARPRDRHSPACIDALAAYPGAAAPTRLHGWEPTVFTLSTRLIRAPRDQRVGDRAWAGCLLRPGDQSRYDGTVLGLPAGATDRPGAFGACASGSIYFRLPCTQPHTIERLGTMSGSLPRDEAAPVVADGLPLILADTLRESCRALAVDLLDTADPTHGGQLDVAVVRSSMVPALTQDPDLVAWSVDCIVDSGELLLTDSVVGRGDTALPTV